MALTRWSGGIMLTHSIKFRWGVLLLLAFLTLGALTLSLAQVQASTSAVTLTVNSALDEPDAAPGDGDCSSTPSGLCTLRAAVQEANALSGSDTIVLPSSTYTLTLAGRDENQAASGDLDITESLTIQGEGTSYTIVDANALDRAYQVFSPAEVTISGLTVQGGDSGTTSGGGIVLSSGSQLTLEDITLSGNTAGDTGGGIYNNGGVLVLNRVRVVANNAATAAGIRNNGSLTISDSTIAGNHATQTGGGIFNTGGLNLNAVTVSGNIADTNGGGLYLHSADPQTGLVTIENSTISGNQAKSFMGGGIWVYYQTELSVTNSTIANNLAGQGGGIFNYHQQAILANPSKPESTTAEGNIHFFNTVVANNSFVNCGRSSQTEPIHSLGHNLDSGDSCEFLESLQDQINTDPLLDPLQDNGGYTFTHALQAGSPAIDQADNNGCPVTDQRGADRPVDGDNDSSAVCDIGAYEYAGDPPVISTPTEPPTPTATLSPSTSPDPTTPETTPDSTPSPTLPGDSFKTFIFVPLISR